MIRILHVVGKMHRGGMESMIMNYYRHMDRERVQFDFLTHYQAEGAFDREIEQMGGRIFRMSVLEDKNVVKYLLDLTRFFRTHREFEIVHGHLTSLGVFYMPIAARAGARVRIIHAHTASHVPGIKGGLTFLLQLPLKHFANWFFACSQEALHWLMSGGTPNPQRTVILNNAIDVSAYRFTPALRARTRARLNLENKRIVGHVGALSPLKNHAFLLEIFNEFSKRIPDAVLVLVGDGELKEKLVQRVRTLGLTDKVFFLGERDDVNELLQAFDLFLFPSVSEGMGIALIEAQAAGLPCFAATALPREVRITEMLHCLPLEQNAEFWAREMTAYCAQTQAPRPDMCAAVARRGFDVAEKALWLERFYVAQYERERGVREYSA